MFLGVLIVSSLLAANQVPARRPNAPPQPAPTSAAEKITLRDGTVVLGLAASMTGGPRGALDLLVRREWAHARLPNRARRWERAIENDAKMAVHQRRQRLAAWLRERSKGRPDDDRTLAIIGAELKRLEAPAAYRESVLLPVRLPRGEIRSLTRQSASNARLLRLGWLCGAADVETMPPESLKDLLESRGFSADGEKSPSLDGLLPVPLEPEAAWMARRAATELGIDADLRFVRHQNLIAPDAGPAQGADASMGGLGLSAALGELSRLLDLDAPREDPLAATLKKIGESGRAGALVTRMELAPDLSRVSVECTLWVRSGPEQWLPFVSRSSSMRSGDVAPGAGRELAEDPQVKSAFAVVEALGLGKVAPELKERSLKMGATTQAALGAARASIGEDLDRLALPFFRGGTANDARSKEAPADKPPARENARPDTNRQPVGREASRPAP